MVRRAYAQQVGHPVGQRDMAQLLAWGDKAYVSYEAGYHVPGQVWEFCLAVAHLTGCDPTWLAGDELPAPDPDRQRRTQVEWHNGCNAMRPASAAFTWHRAPYAVPAAA